MEVLKAKDLDEAINDLEKIVEKEVKNLKVGKTEKNRKVNGLDTCWVEATGKHEGVDIHVFVDLVITPNNHILMILCYVDQTKWEKHEKNINKIYDEIKPHKE
jgi:hypothetical protein